MSVFNLASAEVSNFPFTCIGSIIKIYLKNLSNTEVIHMPFNDGTKILNENMYLDNSVFWAFTQQHYHYRENNQCQQMYQGTETQPPAKLHKYCLTSFYSWSARPLPNYILDKLQELTAFSTGILPVLTLFCRLANFNNMDVGHSMTVDLIGINSPRHI